MDGINSSIGATKGGGREAGGEDGDTSRPGYRWGTGAYSGGYVRGLRDVAGGEGERGRPRTTETDKDSRSRSRSHSRSKSRERSGAGYGGQLSIREWANPVAIGSKDGGTKTPTDSKKSALKGDNALDEDDITSFTSCLSPDSEEEEEEEEDTKGGDGSEDMEMTKADENLTEGEMKEMDELGGERSKLGEMLGITEDNTQGAGSTPKSASFAGGTNFTQKKYPGSHVRRIKDGKSTSMQKSSNVINPYAKAKPKTQAKPTQPHINDHDNHTYIQVQITLKGEPDVPSALTRTLATLLGILQAKDPTACLTKELNVRKQIYSEGDFPLDFREFYDDWSYWDHDVNYLLLAVPPGGNGRTFHGTVCLSTSWEPQRLLDQCVFTIRNLQVKGATIRVSIKELQALRTARNIVLFGVPSDVNYEAVTSLLREMMEEALVLMVDHNPTRYPEEDYHWLPEFGLARMYVKNTPFEERDKNDTTPSWAKMPLHVEVESYFEDYMYEILMFMVTNKIIHQVFGDYVWVQQNAPTNKATTDLKNKMKESLRNHMAIVLSLGRVHLRGLEDPDKNIILERGPDEAGHARKSIFMSVRKVMRFFKVNGIRLWQFIRPVGDGGWCAYYASGKLCETHRILAENWSLNPAAHVRFKCVSRGVVQGDISKFLRSTFSMSAAREGELAKYVNGIIVSEQQASMMAVDLKLKSCKWVNNAAIFTKETGKKAEQHARAFLDDDSMAFPFGTSKSVGGETAALSLINPETGKEWEEGEREQHYRAALEGGMKKMEEDVAETESIASRESDLWENSGMYQFEGMDEVENGDDMDEEKHEEVEEIVEEERKEKGETEELSRALLRALKGSERVNPGEERPLGADINQVLRAAIEAITGNSATTGTTRQNKLDESNTGEDRQATTDGAAGGQGP